MSTPPADGSGLNGSKSLDSGTSHGAEHALDVVITGRNIDVSAHYQRYIENKLAGLERYNRHLIHYEVVLHHENNPRQAKACQRVEITGRVDGSTVRAEARAHDFHAALDAAVNKLEAGLRRNHDRRQVHYGRHQPTSVAAATAALAHTLVGEPGETDHATTIPHGS